MLRNFSFVVEGRLAGMGALRARPGLTDDLIDLARAGVRAVACLAENPPDVESLSQAGFAWLHLPVPDFTAPSLGQIERLVAFVREQNAAGRGVAVHCLAGMGRTGTMLACCLVADGKTAEDAVRTVRRLRPGSVETFEQEQVVRAYAARVAAAGKDG